MQDTDKSRYFAITEFNNNFVSSFDHQVCFHILITSWELREVICHFSLKNVVLMIHEQNIICSKTQLDGTTHEGSYLQVTWWALGQWKGRKNAWNDKPRAQSIEPNFPGRGSKISWCQMDCDRSEQSRSIPLANFAFI